MTAKSQATGHNRTPKKRRPFRWERAFLATLAQTGNVSESAVGARIARSVVYQAREEHPDFAARWDAALEEAADRLEQEARRRAVEGVAEPVFYRGDECGTVQRYSDTLLIFLLKGARPDKYRETVRNEVTGKDGAPLVIREVVVELTKAHDE